MRLQATSTIAFSLPYGSTVKPLSRATAEVRPWRWSTWRAGVIRERSERGRQKASKRANGARRNENNGGSLAY
jgi:hypothetical protein